MRTSAHAPARRPLTRENVLDGRAVAELLHLPISTVLEYARRELLPGHKLGRRWVFLRERSGLPCGAADGQLVNGVVAVLEEAPYL